MVLEQNCTFQNMREWNHEIHRQVVEFKNEHKTFPNILLMNHETLKCIDLVMTQELYQNGLTDKPQGLDVFAHEDYELQVCVSEDLINGEFALLFDDEAEFIEEPSEAEVAQALEEVQLKLWRND